MFLISASVLVLCLSGSMAMMTHTFSMNMAFPNPSPDCSASHHYAVIGPCHIYVMNVVGASNENGIESAVMSNMRAIQDSFSTGDLATVRSRLMNMCEMKYRYDQCTNTALQNCNSSSIHYFVHELRKTNPVYGEVQKLCNGVSLKTEIINDLTSANLAACLATTDGMSLKAKLEKIRMRVMHKMQRVNQTDMAVQSETQDKIRYDKVKSLCQSFRGAINYIKQLFRKYRNANCNEAAKRLLSEQILLDRKAGLERFCQFPDVRQSGSFNNKANRRDMKRVTVGIFGSSHMKVYNQTGGWSTCQEDSNETDVDFINHDHLQISGVLGFVQGGSNSGPTYLKSLKIKFRDSLLNDFESVTMNVGDTNAFQQRMDGNKSEIPAGTTTNGGGRIMGTIKMTKRGNKQLDIRDENSGCFLKVRKFLVNNTIPFYAFIARLPESLLTDGSGILAEGCTKNVDTANYSHGRRRRATVSEAGSYDVAATGDPNAGQMSTDANSDSSTISVYDSLMSTGHVNAKIANSLLTAGLLFTLAKLITG